MSPFVTCEPPPSSNISSWNYLEFQSVNFRFEFNNDRLPSHAWLLQGSVVVYWTKWAWVICKVVSNVYPSILSVTTMFPALMAWVYPGAQWFYDELIPSPPSAVFPPRSSMAISQLANCSFSGGLTEFYLTCILRFYAAWIDFVFSISGYQGCLAAWPGIAGTHPWRLAHCTSFGRREPLYY